MCANPIFDAKTLGPSYPALAPRDRSALAKQSGCNTAPDTAQGLLSVSANARRSCHPRFRQISQMLHVKGGRPKDGRPRRRSCAQPYGARGSLGTQVPMRSGTDEVTALFVTLLLPVTATGVGGVPLHCVNVRYGRFLRRCCL